MVLDYHNNGLIMTIIIPKKSTGHTILIAFKNHCCDDI